MAFVKVNTTFPERRSDKSKGQLSAFLVCLAIFSTFLPFKIYPLFYAVAIFGMVPGLGRLHRSVLWATLFLTYAAGFWFWLSIQPLGAPATVLQLETFSKMVADFVFFLGTASWITSDICNAEVVLKYLNRTFHLIFFITLVQLSVYIHAAGWGPVLQPSSSGLTSSMYSDDLCFWSMASKNVFGARIALFGFLYIMMRFMKTQQIPWFRLLVVMLSAWMSASRTPLLALFVGIAYVLFRKSRWPGKVTVLMGIGAAVPLALASMLRVDKMFDSDDGMGLRLIYWSAFFDKFRGLPLLGSGFMSAEQFLSANAVVYLGEPHIHNLFLNTYLDFGILGVLFYIGFIVSILRSAKRTLPLRPSWYWNASFIPLLIVMLTLFAGYESDTYIYLAGVLIVGVAIHRRPTSVPGVQRRGLWPALPAFFGAVRSCDTAVPIIHSLTRATGCRNETFSS